MENETNSERKRYRIDFLKVKQKLFDSYPINSVQRRELVRGEKSKELIELATTNQVIPKEISDELAKLCKQQLQIHTLKLTAGFVVFAISGILFILFAQTLIELFSTLLLGLGGFYFFLKYAIAAHKDWNVMKRFRTVNQELLNRIEKLKKDIIG